MKSQSDPNEAINSILERNRLVEIDKSWEISFTRRGLIALVTYLAAYAFLYFNKLQNPELQAFIPTGAYILSTLSIPPLKKWWMKYKN
jgi:hypothetical protein